MNEHEFICIDKIGDAEVIEILACVRCQLTCYSDDPICIESECEVAA